MLFCSVLNLYSNTANKNEWHIIVLKWGIGYPFVRHKNTKVHRFTLLKLTRFKGICVRQLPLKYISCWVAVVFEKWVNILACTTPIYASLLKTLICNFLQVIYTTYIFIHSEYGFMSWQKNVIIQKVSKHFKKCFSLLHFNLVSKK